eukprot:TRINITY_DN6053_c1_g1_i1.p2 TRINITY_DN6053_c1_g1~~TRINITY_DN6053_c1_g1_i1.p2  ORF type:complete len:158 (+),score=48.47 TRINITY_DN6053_c1_g1_i1:72-545(+)
MGSCGNACCVIEVGFSSNNTAQAVANALTSAMSPGPDGRYAMQPTAENPTSTGFADLRPFNVSAQFIGQAYHTTLSKHFVDTLNWVVFTDHVRAFSTSQIGGAYGDAGQNYKNLIQVIKSTSAVDASTAKIFYGCGSNNPPNTGVRQKYYLDYVQKK